LKPDKNRARGIGFYLLIGVIILAVIFYLTTPAEQKEYTYSEIEELFRQEQVKSFCLEGDELTLNLYSPDSDGNTTIKKTLSNPTWFREDLGDLIEQQTASGVLTEYDYVKGWTAPWWMSILPYLITIVLFIGVWYLLMNKAGENVSLPELMDMDVNSAIEFCADRKTVSQKLGILKQLGLGYLTLGEETPSLSGGEAQRLKLASEIGRTQTDSVFVFDEPSIGLHPLDVRVLLGVFQALLDNGATVVVIEHDLDVIRNADFLIDMGPGGGEAGGRIVASGTPEEIQLNPDSITGQYL